MSTKSNRRKRARQHRKYEQQQKMALQLPPHRIVSTAALIADIQARESVWEELVAEFEETKRIEYRTAELFVAVMTETRTS